MPVGKIVFEEMPYLLRESRPGVFHAVSAVEYAPKWLRSSHYSYKFRNLDNQELITGEDLIETSPLIPPGNSLRVLLTLQPEDIVVPRAIEALRIIAKNSWHDYFSYFSNHEGRSLEEQIAQFAEESDKGITYILRPRLFRLKHND